MGDNRGVETVPESTSRVDLAAERCRGSRSLFEVLKIDVMLSSDSEEMKKSELLKGCTAAAAPAAAAAAAAAASP